MYQSAIVMLIAVNKALEGEGVRKISPLSDSNLCPGDVVTYKCTVVSYSGTGGVTIWKGSAFDDHCQQSGHEIYLLHSRYGLPGGTRRSCKDGTLEGRSVRVENNHYTSHLIVNLNCNLIGKSVECVYDDGIREVVIGSLNITVGKPDINMHTVSHC